MKFRCPTCDKDVGAGDKVCPTCKEPLHPGALLKRLWDSLKAMFNRAIAVECPVCKEAASLKPGYCMKCGCKFTVSAALLPILRPLRKKWDENISNASPQTKRVFRIGYVIVSAILFWLILGYCEKSGAEWYLYAALSFVYLAVFCFFLFWIVPRRFLARFMTQRKPVEKIGLVFNFLSALLFLQVLMMNWKQRAWMLAMLFVVSWFGFFIFLVYIFPVWNGMATFFTEPDNVFDPTEKQGRTARRG